MAKWYCVAHEHYSENTSAYGYGDCPASIPYLLAVVDADTARQAQAQVRKRFGRVRFGGVGGHTLHSPKPMWLRMAPDARLSERAQQRHWAEYMYEIKAIGETV